MYWVVGQAWCSSPTSVLLCRRLPPSEVLNGSGDKGVYSLLVLRSSLSLNKLLWLLMTVCCRGWLTLSRIASSLLDVLLSAAVTRVQLHAEARLISWSSFDESFRYASPPPSHHSVEKNVCNHRLVEHPQVFPADVE